METVKSKNTINMEFVFSNKGLNKNPSKKERIKNYLANSGMVLIMLSIIGCGVYDISNKLLENSYSMIKADQLTSLNQGFSENKALTMLPELFKNSQTDEKGNFYINKEKYLIIIDNIAQIEKNKLERKENLNVNIFDQDIVKNYLINDELYIQTLKKLENNISDATLLHMISNRVIKNSKYQGDVEQLTNAAKKRLLLSNDIMSLAFAARIEYNTSIGKEYANRIELLISEKMKYSQKEWDKHLEENRFSAVSLHQDLLVKRAANNYTSILELVYQIKNPNKNLPLEQYNLSLNKYIDSILQN